MSEKQLSDNNRRKATTATTKRPKQYSRFRERRKILRQFTEDECFSIIRSVKKHNCLWNVADRNSYKNRKLTKLAWEQVASEVANDVGTAIATDDIAVKWTLLRQQYRVAYSKIRMCKEEEDGGGDTTQRRIGNTFYSAMEFLAPAVAITTDSNNKPANNKRTRSASLSPDRDDAFNMHETIYESSAVHYDDDDDDNEEPAPAVAINDNSRPPQPEPTDYEPIRIHNEDGDDDRTALFNRLGNWLDKNEHINNSSPSISQRSSAPDDKYDALATFMSTLLRNHPNQEEADAVAAEICKLATNLLTGNVRGRPRK